MEFDVSSLNGIKSALDLFRTAMGAAKEAKDMLPDSDEKEAFSKSLEAAEKAVALAEAEAAKSLGYQLCQCTFPPQIMLSQGYDDNSEEKFRCSKCSKSWPPPEQSMEMNYKSPFP
jgi:hypothetical protein